jgi:hypothetical protein
VRADTDDARGTDVAGNVGGDRVFAGTREFEIDPQPDAPCFHPTSRMSAGYCSRCRALMGPAIQAHRDNLNAALKQRAESKAGS